MKNILFGFLLLAIHIGNLFAQGNFEIKDKDRYSKNKIKIQTQWSYDYENGKPSAKGYISTQTTFDTNGNIIQIINFKTNGQIASIVTYTYDSKQNKTSYARFKGNKEELNYTQKLNYDVQNRKISESGFDGMSNFFNTFLYDNNGKLYEIRYTNEKILSEKRVFKHSDNKTEMNILNPTGTLLSKEITTYDNKNNIIEEVKYIQNNASQKANYEYNNSGKKIEETKVNFGNLSFHKKYNYDNQGNLLQVLEYTADGKSYIGSEYKYDARGNVIEEKWTKDANSEYSKKSHKYDSKDLLIETDSYSASYKFSVLYKYTYQTY
jgi:YD repeat-containing protein